MKMKKKAKKRKAETNLSSDEDSLEKSIMETMGKIGDALIDKETAIEPDDEVTLFCNSIAPSLRRLDLRTFACTKLQIQQLILNAEFPM